MAPSTKEEIERQHNDALNLIKEGQQMEYSESTYPIGKAIPICDKQCPTVDLFTTATKNKKDDREEEEKKASESNASDATDKDINIDPSSVLSCSSCFSTLGHVDVTGLQELIREGYNQKYTLASQPTTQTRTETTANKKNKENSTNRSATSLTNLWDPQNATTHNVSITRPSHDSWGINKIALIFCDDFIFKIYHFPYLSKFKEALQPIIDLLPSNSIIIRALFASLPPGITIPVHHDTGEWVKHGHRIHCPIIVNDPSKVIFRCGPTPSNLKRINCIPGHVFELNNQCKHTVSNCSDDYRVHLILDYINLNEIHTTTNTQFFSSKHVHNPIQLNAGEKLIQSRRSIDRQLDIDNEVRPSPTFIILGAQKAGTTSLYEYIMQHPWIARPTRRETHCFDWRWPSSSGKDGTGKNKNGKNGNKKQQPALTKNEDILLHIRNTYFHGVQLLQYPSCLTGDSTPSYLLDSYRVIPRIKQVLYKHGHWKNKLKFMVLLRNPIKRAESHYAMVTSTKGTPAQLKTRGNEWRNLSFQQVVTNELRILDDCGLIPYWNIENGTIDLDMFNTFCNSVEEKQAWIKYMKNHIPLNTGSYGLLTRGLYALQIQSWISSSNGNDDGGFDRNQFLIFQLEKHLKKSENGNSDPLPNTMKQVWDHLDLPYYPVVDSTPRNTREYESPIDDKMKQYLERFFKPHNRRLAKLLNDDEWYNVWDCCNEE